MSRSLREDKFGRGSFLWIFPSELRNFGLNARLKFALPAHVLLYDSFGIGRSRASRALEAPEAVLFQGISTAVSSAKIDFADRSLGRARHWQHSLAYNVPIGQSRIKG